MKTQELRERGGGVEIDSQRCRAGNLERESEHFYLRFNLLERNYTNIIVTCDKRKRKSKRKGG